MLEMKYKNSKKMETDKKNKLIARHISLNKDKKKWQFWKPNRIEKQYHLIIKNGEFELGKEIKHIKK